MKTISYGRQWINKDDINEVVKVLKSDFLTQGQKIPEFEKIFSSRTGAKYAAALSSGTAALHVAYYAAGLKEGDEIITTPMTFAATANAALYLGVKPVFADINLQTGLIDENKIEELITPKTKAIAPVHYAGAPCNMEKIKIIADKYGLKIIEDACHALGAYIGGNPIGSCKYSDMTVFSFHPVKHITTGEGGMITFNDECLYKKAAALRSHGITRNGFIYEADSPCYQEMQELGYNYRLTEFGAALGISQLKRLDFFVERRRYIAGCYREVFKDCKLFDMTPESGNIKHAYHLFPLIFKESKMRDRAYEYLKNNGIICQIHYTPVNKHPYYRSIGYNYKDTPLAYDFYKRELSIPIYPKMTKKDIKYVIKKILKIEKHINY